MEKFSLGCYSLRSERYSDSQVAFSLSSSEMRVILLDTTSLCLDSNLY